MIKINLNKYGLALLLGLFVAACSQGGGSGAGSSTQPSLYSANGTDSVQIVSLTADSALVSGRSTKFTVIYKYHLESLSSTDITLGFNNGTSVTNIPVCATLFVQKGDGIDTIQVTQVVKNWGSAGNFMAYLMMENPNGGSILAWASKILIPQS